MRHYQPEIDDAQTFQLVLRDPAVHPAPGGDGEMLFLYRQVHNSDTLRQFATVGWESPSETDGLQLSYSDVYAPGAAPIGPGLAVLLTTRTPVFAPYVAELAARREAGAVALAWRPVDDRPVAGWLVVRDDEGVETLLTPAPLPAAPFPTDAQAPAGDAVYRLVALRASGTGRRRRPRRRPPPRVSTAARCCCRPVGPTPHAAARPWPTPCRAAASRRCGSSTSQAGSCARSWRATVGRRARPSGTGATVMRRARRHLLLPARRRRRLGPRKLLLVR
jgi:hypothetical protein